MTREDDGRTKLTDHDVELVTALLVERRNALNTARKLTFEAIAEKFEVSECTISRFARRMGLE